MLADRGGQIVHPRVAATATPGSRQILAAIAESGVYRQLSDGGVRMLEPVCGPCVGMGQAPMPELRPYVEDVHIFAPAGADEAERIEIPRGPNTKRPPEHTLLADSLEACVATVQPDDISTGDLAPGGVEVMAYRSNVPAIAEFTLRHRDPDFRKRLAEWGRGFIVAGDNYGQGSSREHAALAPLHLGVKAVIAKSFARIHRRNLLAPGIAALKFSDDSDYDKAGVGQRWSLPKLRDELEQASDTITARIEDSGDELVLSHDFSEHEREILLAGGLLPCLRESNGNEGRFVASRVGSARVSGAPPAAPAWLARPGPARRRARSRPCQCRRR